MIDNELAIPPRKNAIDWRRLVYFHKVDDRGPLFGQLLWFLLWAAVTAFGIYLSPSSRGHGTHMQLGLPPCPSAEVLNRPCPGCGLTTSFTATIHGHIIEAFHAHPMGSFFYLLFTVSALCCGYGWLRTMRFNTEGRDFNRVLGWLIGVFLIFGAARFILVSDYSGETKSGVAVHTVAR